MAKHAFRLPMRTANAFFFAACAEGGLGLTSDENEMDCHRGTQALKLLAGGRKHLPEVAEVDGASADIYRGTPDSEGRTGSRSC